MISDGLTASEETHVNRVTVPVFTIPLKFIETNKSKTIHAHCRHTVSSTGDALVSALCILVTVDQCHTPEEVMRYPCTFFHSSSSLFYCCPVTYFYVCYVAITYSYYYYFKVQLSFKGFLSDKNYFTVAYSCSFGI